MKKNMSPIKVLDHPQEFLLSHRALATLPEVSYQYGHDGNSPHFKKDFEQGKLKPYEGSYVAYHKGNFCGQSKDQNSLAKAAASYYGSSNLNVFEVPKEAGDLEKCIADNLIVI